MTIIIPQNTFNPLQTFDFYKGAQASSITKDTYVDEKSQLQHTYVTSFKTSDFNYNVWMRYCYLRGYSSSNPPPDTNEVQEDFRGFLSTYTSLGIGEDAMALEEPLLDGFYTTYMDSFYGDLPPLVKQDLWNSFLISQNLTQNPVDSPALQAAFAAFIQQKQKLAYFYESQTALSPFEIQKRIILMQVLNALEKYLDVTQQLVNVQAQLLIFYGKWQQEYTQAMTKVPSLSGGGLPGQVKASIVSADAFTFGYADISLSDVIRWGYAQAKNTPGSEFTFGDQATGMGSYTFKVIKTGGKEDLKIDFKRHTSYQEVNWDKTATIAITPVLDSKGNTITLDFSAVVAKAGEGFINLFKEIPNFKDTMDTLYIPDLAKWAYKRIIESKDALITFGNLNDTSATNRFQLSFAYVPWENGDYIRVNYKTAAGEVYEPTISDVYKINEHNMPEEERIQRMRDLIVQRFGGIANIPKIGTLGISGYYLGTEETGLTYPDREIKVGDTTQKITINYGSDLNQKEIDARAEQQATLSLYTENLRSLRSQVTNKSSQQQTALTQTKESINQQTSLWTSILESIQGVMSAIVKRRG